LATERATSVVGLLGRDDWQVGWNHEVNTCACVWHKVDLILGVVDMESKSNRTRAAREEITCQTRRFKLVQVDESVRPTKNCAAAKIQAQAVRSRCSEWAERRRWSGTGWSSRRLNTCAVQAGVESSSCGREGLHLFDADQSGAIEFRELKAAMRSLGFEVKNGGVERSGSFSPISRWSGGEGLGEVDGAVGEHLLELLVLDRLHNPCVQ